MPVNLILNSFQATYAQSHSRLFQQQAHCRLLQSISNLEAIYLKSCNTCKSYKCCKSFQNCMTYKTCKNYKSFKSSKSYKVSILKFGSLLDSLHTFASVNSLIYPYGLELGKVWDAYKEFKVNKQSKARNKSKVGK